jgi:hypothetical protein
MSLGVVMPCHRQEHWLSRTVPAVERALAGRDWRGALVVSSPRPGPLPALSEHWQVVAPSVAGRTTPGASRMAGFATCGGDWVLFADADIEVDAAWMAEALEVAARRPVLAGIGGRLEEWFERDGRQWAGSPDLLAVGHDERAVGWLGGLALYRRAALEQVGGYDARFHSDEDFELGLRLGAAGHTLVSLGRLGGRHWSPPRPSLGELARRWRSGLVYGPGEVMRAYLGRPGFDRLLLRHGHYGVTLAVWAAGLVALIAGLSGAGWSWLGRWALLPLAAIAWMTLRKRSLAVALHSLATWTVIGVGALAGFLRSPTPASVPAHPVPERGGGGGGC